MHQEERPHSRQEERGVVDQAVVIFGNDQNLRRCSRVPIQVTRLQDLKKNGLQLLDRTVCHYSILSGPGVQQKLGLNLVRGVHAWQGSLGGDPRLPEAEAAQAVEAHVVSVIVLLATVDDLGTISKRFVSLYLSGECRLLS